LYSGEAKSQKVEAQFIHIQVFMETSNINNNASNATQAQTYQFQFLGKGSEYFSIMIVNWILIIITLGIYYPWAKAKRLKYTSGQTVLNGERFNFAGTGKEMFSGFIKIVVFELIVIAIFLALVFGVGDWLGILLAYLIIFASLLVLQPLVIHGAFRYVMQRTTYRGIRFGYRGDRTLLFKNGIKWALLTIITFGIYGAWEAMKIRRYTHQNVRYGDAEFDNDCNGLDFFILNLKGFCLSILTLGIFIFWWQKDLFNYHIDRMSMTKGDQKVKLHSTATGGGFFKLRLINFFIVVFTLGFGTAWAEMRIQRFIWSHIKMEGDINIDEIQQTEAEFDTATRDFFDLNTAYIV
jgi:uncharacterized membrane protein YjgN (DUF898 family)